MSIFELDSSYIANTYKRFPVALTEGKGSLVYDIDGKEYIDLGSGIGVNAFGYSDDVWKNAVVKQLDRLQHTSNLYYTEPGVLLAKLICERTGMSKVFFSNSGAEANECAIKAARKYCEDTKSIEDGVIITLKNSFHGRTLATLAATGQDVFHKSFLPITPGFDYITAEDYSCAEEIFEKYQNRIAAVMVECVQGEGGVITLSADYLKYLYGKTKEVGALFIVDEVQTGNGRTGALYSYMNYDITPDIFTTAKGLGGGLPIGATVFSEKCASVYSYGDHGSTFGANPVSCAGALSVLSRIDNDFLESVKRKSSFVFSKFSECDKIESVSGMGLMIGIKPKYKTSSEVVSDCIKKGVLLLTAKDKVRLLPPLNIPDNILEKAVDIIISAL